VRLAQPPREDPKWRVGGLAVLLPEHVCVEELRGDLTAYPDDLMAAERDVVRRAAPRRRGEFAAVRGCARRALVRLGVPAGPILPDDGGAPLWPEGVVGSMTHTDGYCAAAVASARLVRSVGIDAEIHHHLDDGVRSLVLTRPEQERLRGLPRGLCWDMVSFSGKEAVFKAWYPLGLAWLSFHDVVLRFQPERGGFVATVRPSPRTARPIPVMAIEGRFGLRDGVIMTTVVVR
jgi:4'-phosphopantetheinyl transferase EntD